jgi:hypothetical protein
MLWEFARGSLLVATLTLAGGPRTQAQTVSGRFLTVINGDTTAVEKFTRTAAQLTGEIVQRAGATIKFTAQLLPDASVSRLEFTSTQGAQSAAAVIVFKGDTAYIEAEGRSERRPAAAGSVPIIPISFALFEQAVLRSAKLGAATQTLPMFGVVGLRSFEAGVSRPSADSAIVTIGNLPLRFKLDSRGLVTSGSSTRGSNPVVVLRAR